jgi:hypothetical protein
MRLIKSLFALVAMASAEQVSSPNEAPHNVPQLLPQKAGAGSTIDWYTSPFFDDKFRQSVVQHGYVPSKGIPLKVFAGGPFEPAEFRA